MLDNEKMQRGSKEKPYTVCGIPEEMMEYRNWVVWKHEARDGKKTKIPYSAITYEKASSTDPKTWASYDDTIAALASGKGYTGIGFVFSDNVPYSGIDLDHCIIDGDMETWADNIVSFVGSYAEKSFSGDGAHIIVKGKLPKGHKCKTAKLPPEFNTKSGEFEVYCRSRYFVMTGKHLKGTPKQIMEKQGELEKVYAEIFGQTEKKTEATKTVTATNTGSDADLLEAIRKSKQGYKFCKLYDRGDISEYSDDDSTADLALCCILAFWCGNDYERIERLFGQSALGKRDKWINRQDYRERTITAAIEQNADKKCHSRNPADGEASKDWPDIIKFSNLNLPVFPLEQLPNEIDEIKQFIRHAAIAYQVPVDMPGMLVLAAAGAACAKNFTVEMKSGWQEPTNLYVLIVLEPGNRKSAIFRLTTKSIYEFERRLREDFAPLVEQNQSKLRMLKKRQEHLEKKITQSSKEDVTLRDELTEVTRKIAEFQEIAEPTIIVDDVTSEAITTALNQNGGKLALLSSEGDLFDQIVGRYSKNLNLNVYLKGHAGDAIKVNRMGRSSEYIESPALTIGICSQREVLRGMNKTQALRGRGLVGRFLYSIPESILGSREINPEPLPKQLKAGYDAMISRLFGMTNNNDEPHILLPDTEALQLFDGFQHSIEKRLNEDDGDLSYMSDWAGKLCGQVARIAGILHVMQWHNNAHNTAISASSVRAAISLGQYLIPHAKAAFNEMQVDPCIRISKRIVRWILRKQETIFSRRDLFRTLEGGSITKVDDLQEPLELLEKHGYIRLLPVDKSGKPGRPKGPDYEVNLSVFEMES